MQLGQLRIRKILKNEKGIGLIETLLALGIGVIIITAMVSLAVFTLRASIQNKLALEGSQLANQEIELIRAYRDSTPWTDFLADIDGTNGPNCFVSACNMISSSLIAAGEGISNAGTAEEISKSFMVTDQSGGSNSLLRFAVTVNWQVGADAKSANNYTELSNWRGN